VKADGLGSGVHIHFSLWNAEDVPVSYDPEGPCGMSEVAGQFLSGIVRHMPALCAVTAPTPVSYLRLVSHSWTGVWSNVGLRDREAGLRICPTFGPPEATARQFNFEYRPADATANPYLQLALIIRAGLSGIRDRLPPPIPTVDEDPETMSTEDRAARSIVRLPEDADAALAALEADDAVKGFLPPRLLDCYLANKRHEFDAARGWTPEELCRRYSEIF
jgi:glutamine synthetase